MTKEEKQLLLQVLSAMLPYGVIVRHADYLVDSDGNYTGQFWYKRGYLCNICKLDNMTTTIVESEGSDEEGYEHICDLERSLPYLRPMSNMTEEEKKIMRSCGFELIPYDTGYTGFANIENCIDEISFRFMEEFLNAHHFDYRGLIPMGLAIEAPEGMYNN